MILESECLELQHSIINIFCSRFLQIYLIDLLFSRAHILTLAHPRGRGLANSHHSDRSTDFKKIENRPYTGEGEGSISGTFGLKNTKNRHFHFSLSHPRCGSKHLGWVKVKNHIHIQAGEGSCLDGALQKVSASRFLIFWFLYTDFHCIRTGNTDTIFK